MGRVREICIDEIQEFNAISGKTNRVLWAFGCLLIIYAGFAVIWNCRIICKASDIHIDNIDDIYIYDGNLTEVNNTSDAEKTGLNNNEDLENLAGVNNSLDASDMYSLYDEYVNMDEIEDRLRGIGGEYNTGLSVSFREIYELLVDGEISLAVSKCIEGIGNAMTYEILNNRKLLLRLMVLIIIAAVFNNYSSVLKYSYVGEQGFFITYLMSCAILLESFFMIYDMSEEAIYYISEAMKCMLPAFVMSLIMCSGIVTSQMTNSIFIMVLGVMEKVLLLFVLPMIRIYFLIILLNQLNGKDRFSKLAELIKQISEWILKGFVAGVIGLNAVKSMIVPVAENVKYNMLQKGISLIPGGSSLSGISSIFIGAGVLIKNCVGVTAAIVLLVIGSIPILKLLYFYICYRLVLAAAQPISDQRILAGIQGACDSTAVLIKTVMTAIALCVLSLAIIILTTNVRLYT